MPTVTQGDIQRLAPGLSIDNSTIDGFSIGSVTPAAGVFTTLQSTTRIPLSPQAVGAALTVTTAMAGKSIILDTAAGSVVTLPAATGSGATYRFIVKTTVTSNAHKILAASSSDFLQGIVTGSINSTGVLKGFVSAAATNHSIQMPFTGSTPSGGFAGDYFEFYDIAANIWEVDGMFGAGTTATTPFSTSTT